LLFANTKKVEESRFPNTWEKNRQYGRLSTYATKRCQWRSGVEKTKFMKNKHGNIVAPAIVTDDFEKYIIADHANEKTFQIPYERTERKPEFKEFLRDHNFHVLERFHCLVKNCDWPIIAVNLNLKIIFANSAAHKSFGIDQRSFSRLPLETCTMLEEEKDCQQWSAWEGLFKNGLLIGVNFKRRINCANGLKAPVVLKGSPLFDYTGDLVGMVILFEFSMPSGQPHLFCEA
jgi:PAS domain-containing protein